MNNEEKILSYIYSDEGENYRTPLFPKTDEKVKIRLRTGKETDFATLFIEGANCGVPMEREKEDKLFRYFTAELFCGEENIRYFFIINQSDKVVIYDKSGAHTFNGTKNAENFFLIIPSFSVPSWAIGCVEYQIFTDRFYNGDKTNDVKTNEYYYIDGHSEKVEDWFASVNYHDIRRFYGGDLQGVYQKLDYIASLGVKAIYLNPVFVSPSSHKYDVQDYNHIDPHLAIIEDDCERYMQDWEKHNGFAPKYIKRVLSETNLNKSDEYFAFLCREIHKRGMKIILDGVFNHCGSFNKWLDREGVYLNKEGYSKGAFSFPDSEYREYFAFDSDSPDSEYEGWWGHKTLPKLNYENSRKLCEEIFAVAEKWVKPPYSIDGWRLDVGADLGHSEDFNHAFWKEFRTRVKAVNKDVIIIAEHYGDPSAWLNGKEWDTVMNYDAFMEPLSYFLTGMEKHSNEYRADLYNDGKEFFKMLKNASAHLPYQSLSTAMNELSNHDHSRFLTRTNRTAGKLKDMGSEGAERNIDKRVYKEAVVFQMTYLGAPTIYYGDEAGQVGFTDPDNRRTYPWGREDTNLIAFHKSIASFRKEHSALSCGSFLPIYAEGGTVSYARFNEKESIIVVINNEDYKVAKSLFVRQANVSDGKKKATVFDAIGNISIEEFEVKNGELSINVDEKSAKIIVF
ncbi:MAG: glycoside hydrolase family 13 protein [Clostridia bacterium]|nr:glycoside hydrolase family 13 protein [Clostridia bacterium]